MDVTSVESVEAFVTKDGSTIRELHHTEVQSLAEATLEVEQATERHYHRAHRGDLLRAEGPGPDGGRRRVTHVRPGDAVLIPAGAWHQLENNGTSELRILCCCAPPYSHDDTFFE